MMEVLKVKQYHRIVCAGLILTLIGCAFTQLQAGRISEKEIGISVVVPEGWWLQSKDEMIASIRRVDPERAADTSNVVFKIVKYKEPTEKLNPTVYFVRLPFAVTPLDFRAFQLASFIIKFTPEKTRKSTLLWAPRPTSR